MQPLIVPALGLVRIAGALALLACSPQSERGTAGRNLPPLHVAASTADAPTAGTAPRVARGLTPAVENAVVLAAGDIASCRSLGDEATARLLDEHSGTIAALGDLAYNDGTTREFADCFHPSWGRHKARIHPTPGNHEYHQRDAAPYFAYFGSRAGNRSEGYYSYDVGDWHIVVLNNYVPTGSDSRQMAWLRRDLAASRHRCTLAYFHRPRFSSGTHGTSTSPRRLWRALSEAGADIVLSSHDHHYERFAPQSPDGEPDPQGGIRQWVVGTGGSALTKLGTPMPNSEVRDNTTHGVLKLTLKATGYEWQFLPVAGGRFTDTGTGTCH